MQLGLELHLFLEVLQINQQIFCSLIAVLAILANGFTDDSFHFVGHLGSKFHRRRRLSLQDFGDNVAGRLTSKRLSSRDHLIKHRSQAENVAARVNLKSPRLFWGHVFSGSNHHSRFAGRRRDPRRRATTCVSNVSLVQFGDPEIEYFDDAVVSHDHVVGLDIAMNNSAGMGRSQSARNLDGNINRGIQFHSATRETVAKCDSFNVFGRDKSQAICVAEFIDSENVGVIKRGHGVRLVFETPQATLISSEFRGQQFDRNLASEALILRQIDFTHSPSPQHGNDFVMGQFSAGRNGAAVAMVVHDVLRRIEYRLLQKIHGLFGRLQQTFYFFSQLGVSSAVLIEKRCACLSI